VSLLKASASFSLARKNGTKHIADFVLLHDLVFLS
jgi:hypothetical protein